MTTPTVIEITTRRPADDDDFLPAPGQAASGSAGRSTRAPRENSTAPSSTEP